MCDYKGIPNWNKVKSEGKTDLSNIIHCLEGIKAVDDLWEILLEHMYYRKDFISIYRDEDMKKIIESDEYSFQQYFISLKLPPGGYVHKFMSDLIESLEDITINVDKCTLARVDFIIRDNCIHIYFIDHINDK